MSTGTANPAVTITPTSKVSSIFPGDYAAADEGSFFTSTLAITASNAVATVSVATANANPFLAIQNQWPVGLNSFNIYPRYVKLLVTTVMSTASVVNYATALDPLQAKLTTTGTLMGTPVNANVGSVTLSKALLYSGVNVAAALSAGGRQIASGQVSGAISVAFDEYIWHFGQPVFGGDQVGTITLVKRITIPHPPAVIGPQTWFTMGLWGTSWAGAAAPSYQIEVGWIERPTGQ